MMRKAYLQTTCAFLAGGLVAWCLKPRPAAEQHRAESVPVALHDRSSERPLPPAKPDPKAVEFLARLKEVQYYPEKQKDLLHQLSAKDIPDLLKELGSRAGVEGLDYEEKHQLKTLLLKWHGESPDAAFAWMMTLKSKKDRKTYLGELVEATAKTDYAVAMRLLEQFKAQEGGKVSIPYSMFSRAAEKGEDALLHLCGLSVTEGNSSSGSGIDSYPAQFDFRKVLDGLAEMKQTLPKGQTIGEIPSNLLTEWAARDADAAWTWLKEEKKVSFNDGVDDFMKGYAKTATPEQVGQFLGSVFDPAPFNAYREAFEVLMEYPTPEAMNSFLDGLSGERADHLYNLIVKGSFGWSGDKPNQCRVLALRELDTPQRVAAITNLYGKLGAHEDVRQSLRPELRRLGHTDEEIERMVPPRKKS